MRKMIKSNICSKRKRDTELKMKLESKIMCKRKERRW
jgi:hypothetical protein